MEYKEEYYKKKYLLKEICYQDPEYYLEKGYLDIVLYLFYSHEMADNYDIILWCLKLKKFDFLKSLDFSGFKCNHRPLLVCLFNLLPSYVTYKVGESFVEKFKAEIKDNIINSYYNALFYESCKKGDIETLNDLELSKGLDFFKKEKWVYQNALDMALKYNNIDILKWLQTKGFFDLLSEASEDIFINACFNGYLEAIKYLLEYKKVSEDKRILINGIGGTIDGPVDRWSPDADLNTQEKNEEIKNRCIKIMILLLDNITMEYFYYNDPSTYKWDIIEFLLEEEKINTLNLKNEYDMVELLGKENINTLNEKIKSLCNEIKNGDH